MPHSLKATKEDEYRLLQMGLNVAFYRSFAGYTQEELAEACGMSRTYISKVEVPNMVSVISLPALFRLADVLGVEPARLLETR